MYNAIWYKRAAFLNLEWIKNSGLSQKKEVNPTWLSLASDIIVSDMKLTRENNIVQSAIDKILPPIPCNFFAARKI
jgi:hypothetical protein